MKKLQLSKFDLGFIIAFGVVALWGAGAWWYLSGELQSAQSDDARAKADFDKYSVKSGIVVSLPNGKTLQEDSDVLKAQLTPLIHDKLQSKDNKLRSIEREDPVAWKHDLDEDVHGLNDAAKVRAVTLPKVFYYGFSRYLSQSPNDEQTVVLSKQLDGIQELSTILIDAPVKAIRAIRRTYEEDPHTASSDTSGATGDIDRLRGFSINAPGNLYTDYPFEVEFDTTSENLRTVLNNLLQSPYIFVVRVLTIQNASPNSPSQTDLDKLAGPPPTPGSTTPAKGPQFLFGNSLLKVKARIDMIEWKADLSQATSATAPAPAGTRKTAPSAGGNR